MRLSSQDEGALSPPRVVRVRACSSRPPLRAFPLLDFPLLSRSLLALVVLAWAASPIAVVILLVIVATLALAGKNALQSADTVRIRRHRWPLPRKFTGEGTGV